MFQKGRKNMNFTAPRDMYDVKESVPVFSDDVKITL